MKHLGKILIVVAAVVLAVAIIGAYYYPKAQIPLGSTVGATFNTAKIAQVNINPSSGTATSSSILNTDGSDRWVETGFASCNGVLTASTSVSALMVQAATTSVANSNLQGNTNLALNMTVSTSSTYSNQASTTVPATGVAGIWKAGSYMTFLFNATDTGACTVGVHYHGS